MKKILNYGEFVNECNNVSIVSFINEANETPLSFDENKMMEAVEQRFKEKIHYYMFGTTNENAFKKQYSEGEYKLAVEMEKNYLQYFNSNKEKFKKAFENEFGYELPIFSEFLKKPDLEFNKVDISSLKEKQKVFDLIKSGKIGDYILLSKQPILIKLNAQDDNKPKLVNDMKSNIINEIQPDFGLNADKLETNLNKSNYEKQHETNLTNSNYVKELFNRLPGITILTSRNSSDYKDLNSDNFKWLLVSLIFNNIYNYVLDIVSETISRSLSTKKTNMTSKTSAVKKRATASQEITPSQIDYSKFGFK